jgi:hypothetical protein
MVVSVSEVGRAGGESRRGEGPTQAKRGRGEEVGEGGGGVVRSCGGGREEEEEDGAPETSFKNKSCSTPPCVANGSATGQRREAECGRCRRAIQFSGGGDGEHTTTITIIKQRKLQCKCSRKSLSSTMSIEKMVNGD